MKVLALAIVALVAACQIQGRADDYRCDGTSCEDGRVCVEGWCVVGSVDIDASLIDADPNAPDADPTAPDAGPCPSPCTSCAGNVCTVLCAGQGACASTIVCPTGMDCVVECDGTSSCGGGINCVNSTACTVNCDGSRSCGGTISCGPGRCALSCNLDRTCSPPLVETPIIDCGSSCACDATCLGAMSCDGTFLCSQAGACNAAVGLGCTSTGVAGCDTCP